MVLKEMKTIGSGSYQTSDVTFLLKDVSHIQLEDDVIEREHRIQTKQEHYSESLPIEKLPEQDYIDFYKKALQTNGQRTAELVREVSIQLHHTYNDDLVLVSLARAGTPVGILLKRYLAKFFSYEIPHYSVSIIRGKGIDWQALQFIIKKHESKKIIFVDGWTGKGSITNELKKSCEGFNEISSRRVEPILAVLSDPARCSTISGTREDILLPHACLNATVSGLVSRTILNKKWIHDGEFHGAKFYKEWLSNDYSNQYVNEITALFSKPCNVEYKPNAQSSFSGMEEVKRISKEFSIDDLHLIKPSIGETTRVLLRRLPWKILVKDSGDPQTKHILHLAHQKNIEVIEYKGMTYSACGIIRPLGEERT
ncbi:cysteine protease StiP family protein [Bacillus carboniphilus]|uniref:Cysteine protease StiP family protein n=1 Tax=Bacillus carboniphilus TaxID=86663 RepID=A0ABP3GL76_9BACI